MICRIVFALLAAFAALAPLALAGPTGLRSMEIRDTVNRTVCPFETVVDYDPNRVPRSIKMIKCSSAVNECARPGGKAHHECCHSRHGLVMECVEIRDTVLVAYGKDMKPLEVAVGCTCLVEQGKAAQDVPQPPS